MRHPDDRPHVPAGRAAHHSGSAQAMGTVRLPAGPHADGLPVGHRPAGQHAGRGPLRVVGVSAGGPLRGGLCVEAGRAPHPCGDRLGGGAVRSARGRARASTATTATRTRWRPGPSGCCTPSWPCMTASVRRNPSRALSALMAHCSPDDRAVAGGSRASPLRCRASASRPRARGCAACGARRAILVSPWGFPLEEIRTEVHLWYWEGDSIVPPQMGRYLAKRLPRDVRTLSPRWWALLALHPLEGHSGPAGTAGVSHTHQYEGKRRPILTEGAS